jgi:phosphoribosyl 1,2-cyclic phosphodiesterase
MLLDAGIGPRIVSRRLTGAGVQVSDVSAICLTHLDRDHFAPVWVNHIVRLGIIVHCHERCVDDLKKIAENRLLAALIRPFGELRFTPMPGVAAIPIALAHDREGSHGFVLEGYGRRIGYATDLGYVPDPLVEHFSDLDVLALESNYDPHMQERSPRPIFLKRRITGGSGHLSNQQALDAIRRMLDQAERRERPLPAHIVLLHRSRQCNCPRLVRELFSTDPRIAPRLVLTEAFSRSEWLSAAGRPVAVGEQLLLAW